MAYGFNSDKSRVNINDATEIYVSGGIHHYDSWVNSNDQIRVIEKTLSLNYALENYDWIEIFITGPDGASGAYGPCTWHELINVNALLNQLTYSEFSMIQMGWFYESSEGNYSPIVVLGTSSGSLYINVDFPVPGSSTTNSHVLVMGYGSHS